MSRTKVEAALGWKVGALEELLEGADLSAAVLVDAPVLPRNAPNAPVLSGLDRALGVPPIGHKGTQLPMSTADRQLMVAARNKLYKNKADFTSEELSVLTRFVEDDELRMLHARIDWLPRPEQLEVSELVTELEARVDQQLYDLGVRNETEIEDMPAGAPRPNPLPQDGIFPDPQDFPPQIRSMRTPTTGDEDEAESPQETPADEVATRTARVDRTTTTGAAGRGKDVDATPRDPVSSVDEAYELAARKGITQREWELKNEPQPEDEAQGEAPDGGA